MVLSSPAPNAKAPGVDQEFLQGAYYAVCCALVATILGFLIARWVTDARVGFSVRGMIVRQVNAKNCDSNVVLALSLNCLSGLLKRPN